VAIIGRPSAGKSTLVNTLCGHKVSIISPVPQTTRNRVRGIVNRDGNQLVLVDTPGFHLSDRTLNRHMRGLIEETIRDSDLILYLIDASRRAGEEERQLAGLVAQRSAETPVVIAVNKTDVASRRDLEHTEALIQELLPSHPAVRISAKTGASTDTLVSILMERVPEDAPPYPEDFYTDQPPEFRVGEIIREKAIAATRKELPHSIYVDVADMEVRTDEDRELLWIRAFVLVERNSQQGIVVGKGGEKIKQIRQSAQKEIARLFPYAIHLDLRVKVRPNWHRDERLLTKLVN
jgi:GTP-binding protein Era